MEELIQTNSLLNDEVAQLQRKLKDFVAPERHGQVQQDLDARDEQVHRLTKEKQQLVKMFDTLSKERDQAQEDFTKAKHDKQIMSVELTSMTATLQSSQNERKEQEMIIQQSIKEIQQNLKDEIEQKVCFQREARDNENLGKLLEEENETIQS